MIFSVYSYRLIISVLFLHISNPFLTFPWFQLAVGHKYNLNYWSANLKQQNGQK